MEKQYKITEKCGYYTVENANGPVHDEPGHLYFILS